MKLHLDAAVSFSTFSTQNIFFPWLITSDLSLSLLFLSSALIYLTEF